MCVRAARLVKIGFVSVAMFAVVSCASQTAPGVNPVAIPRVKVGMTKQQVTAILGEPLRLRLWEPDDAIVDYAIPFLAGPSLWIHFGKELVTTAQTKRHRLLFDDRAVYEEAAHHPTFETADFELMFGRRR